MKTIEVIDELINELNILKNKDGLVALSTIEIDTNQDHNIIFKISYFYTNDGNGVRATDYTHITDIKSSDNFE